LPLTISTPDLSASWNVFAVAEETPLPLDNPDVVGSVWGWDGTKYVRAQTSLQPDKGYWVAANMVAQSPPSGRKMMTPIGTSVLDLTLNMELSGVDKGYLEVGLTDGGEEILDPAPPASPDGFTCYIFGRGPSPFNRLSMKTSVLALYADRYSWIIVAQVPAGQDFSLSWDNSDLPENVELMIAKMNPQDGLPEGGSLSMRKISSVSGRAAVSSAFAWKIEATCRATASQDSDGDLIPDDWELQHFPQGACDPERDEDRDGMTNLDEFIAGTDPADPLSVLDLSPVRTGQGGGDLALSWQSVPGRKYQILCCDSLLEAWRCVGTEIEGTGSVLVIEDDISVADAGQRFYRVRVW
jgi:hypothetical protein